MRNDPTAPDVQARLLTSRPVPALPRLHGTAAALVLTMLNMSYACRKVALHAKKHVAAPAQAASRECCRDSVRARRLCVWQAHAARRCCAYGRRAAGGMAERKLRGECEFYAQTKKRPRGVRSAFSARVYAPAVPRAVTLMPYTGARYMVKLGGGGM